MLVGAFQFGIFHDSMALSSAMHQYRRTKSVSMLLMVSLKHSWSDSWAPRRKT